MLTSAVAFPPLVAPLTMAEGREAAEALFSSLCDAEVVLRDGGRACHQYGNTPAGLRFNGDIRTLHVVNANTVAAFNMASGLVTPP